MGHGASKITYVSAVTLSGLSDDDKSHMGSLNIISLGIHRISLHTVICFYVSFQLLDVDKYGESYCERVISNIKRQINSVVSR